MNHIHILSCIAILVSIAILSVALYRLDNHKSSKQAFTMAQMDASGQCVKTQGYNPFDAECCKGLTAFSGTDGDYCLQKGDPQCMMVCQNEACEQGEGGVDPTCAARCSKVC